MAKTLDEFDEFDEFPDLSGARAIAKKQDEIQLSVLDLWRLCDQLTIVQAALLLSGHDPSHLQDSVESQSSRNRPDGYEAAKAAITRALSLELVKGERKEIPTYDYDGHLDGTQFGTIDVGTSLVDVDSLRNWLSVNKMITTGFFFSGEGRVKDYLNPEHPRYSFKLAAVILAWEAMEGADLEGRSPKSALEKWLREHAAQFNLSDNDGKPNETGISECAKVANWQITGGAPKTPS